MDEKQRNCKTKKKTIYNSLQLKNNKDKVTITYTFMNLMWPKDCCKKLK